MIFWRYVQKHRFGLNEREAVVLAIARGPGRKIAMDRSDGGDVSLLVQPDKQRRHRTRITDVGMAGRHPQPRLPSTTLRDQQFIEHPSPLPLPSQSLGTAYSKTPSSSLKSPSSRSA